MATIDLKLKSYDELQFEIMRLTTDNYLKDKKIQELEQVLNNIHTYIEKMSYCDIVDNPKKELSRILERDNNI